MVLANIILSCNFAVSFPQNCIHVQELNMTKTVFLRACILEIKSKENILVSCNSCYQLDRVESRFIQNICVVLLCVLFISFSSLTRIYRALEFAFYETVFFLVFFFINAPAKKKLCVEGYLVILKLHFLHFS